MKKITKNKKLFEEQKKVENITFKKIIYLYFTKIVKKFFSIFNLDIKKKEIKINEVYFKLLKGKICIFDVGANTGQSIDRFNNALDNPIIHSFEPIPECFEKLMQKYYNYNNVILNNFAAGNKNIKKKFYVNKLSYNSSFLKSNLNYHQKKLYKKEKNIIVQSITLDKYIEDNDIDRIDILKIDTQGYELNVLKGSTESLKNKIKFVELEITVEDSYLNNPKIHEIDKYLSLNSFKLFKIENIFYDKKKLNIRFFDAVYVNKNLMK